MLLLLHTHTHTCAYAAGPPHPKHFLLCCRYADNAAPNKWTYWASGGVNIDVARTQNFSDMFMTYAVDPIIAPLAKCVRGP
jgi:hypothetical protein